MPRSNNTKRDKKRKQSFKKEIIFDAQARRDYLVGFSERKRQRRAYGLAMQKCNDRKAKLQDKRELKKAELERVEEAERLKENGTLENEEENIETLEETESSLGAKATPDTTVTYQDSTTRTQFGGAIIVTTSTMPLLHDDDDDNSDVMVAESKKHKSIDKRQLYAGNVNKFLKQVTANMPSKHNHHSKKHKGRHGACTMKGMGEASDVKLARKALAKTQKGNNKSRSRSSKGRHGGKKKR